MSKMTMSKKPTAYFYVITLPFAISAAFEFLPAWLYWPTSLLCAMAWIGACGILAEKEQA